MLEVILKGHEKYYLVSDVVRLFCGVPEELKEEHKVIAPEGPDAVLVNELFEDGRCVTYCGDKEYEFNGAHLEPGREIRRSLYMALSDVTSKSMPWGCLTGIRPTLVAWEEESAEDLIEKYLVRPDKAELAFETSREEQRLLSKVPEESLGVYVGIPFCPSRCQYCSFISSDISCHMDRLVNYEAALEREIKAMAPHINRPLSSLYVGGGTPTVFEEREFAALLHCIYSNLKITPDCEVTVEAGRPDTITARKLEAMRDHGITRICINPQTMKSETLQKLGRKHTAEDTVRVYRQACEMGFDLINMDLIAGLPYENAEEHVKSTKKLIELAPANITVHTLMPVLFVLLIAQCVAQSLINLILLTLEKRIRSRNGSTTMIFNAKRAIEACQGKDLSPGYRHPSRPASHNLLPYRKVVYAGLLILIRDLFACL